MKILCKKFKTALSSRIIRSYKIQSLGKVGVDGFEPPTLCL